ncbi:VCBS repeat-containing protein [Novipirellula rosea]
MSHRRYDCLQLWIASCGLAIVLLFVSVGCSDLSSTVSPTKPTVSPATTAAETSGSKSIAAAPQARQHAADKQAFVTRMRPQVEAFCGDCHVMPKSANVDREHWPREVAKGFEFYRISGRTDLHVPDVQEVTDYFVSLAPEKLVMPASIAGNPFSVVDFQPTPIHKSVGRSVAAQPPCISSLKWVDLDSNGRRSLVYCDLGTATLYKYQPDQKNSAPQTLAVLYQPVQFDLCDLNEDKRMDLLVADLGEFLPADSDLGRVVWLKRQETGEQFESIVLQEGLGRVTDVKPGDFDSDGDTDILVAEFGWRKTGRILMLENIGVDEQGQPKFDMRVIDDRHGTIETPVVDLNGDGHLDFVALISQEFEIVEAFINQGNGQFETQTIWQADDPMYGSARIELADVDGDGDTDVVYANGDSFDTGSKPYHSVQWLENQGTFPFQHHHITFMPGVLAIKLADFDQDGDLDIVAGALVPERFDASLEAAGVESLILLEQVSSGEFKRTKIEVASNHHGAIEVGDFDDDGHIDIAVGNFLHFHPHLPSRHDFTLWMNQGRR